MTVFKPVDGELYSAFMAEAIVHKFMFALRIRNSMEFLTLRLPFFSTEISKERSTNIIIIIIIIIAVNLKCFVLD
jgi:hypothetical protein